VSSSTSDAAEKKEDKTSTIDVPNAIQFEDKYFITPLAIQEAGIFAVCRSRAWQAKIITSSYWVRASQVSKTAPSGEFLTTGSFMIYGKKNYLPPMPLEMGFGILFRLDDTSIVKNHNNGNEMRKIKTYEMDDDESVVSYHDAVERYGIEEVGEVLEREQLEKGKGKGRKSEKETQEVEIPETVVEEAEEENDDDDDDDDDTKGQNDVKESDNEDDNDNQEEDDSDSIAEAAASLSVAESKVVVEKNIAEPVGQNNKGGPKASVNPSLKSKNKGKNKGNNSDNKKEKQSQIQPEQKAQQEKPASTPETTAAGSKQKGKFVNKKKARRYAEQDEEDRELAMMILGHSSSKGEKLADKIMKVENAKKTEDIRNRQVKAGVNLLQINWQQLMSLQLPVIREELEKYIDEGFIKEGDIDEDEMRNLSIFSEENGLRILSLFHDSKQTEKIANKSGFLSGIMRRVSRESEKNQRINDDKKGSGNSSSSSAIRKQQQLKQKEEEQQIAEINLEEGILEEDESTLKYSDDTEKLYESPLPEDVILYAVPVCSPYLSMKNFKYKVKLTPGSAKKGKAIKQIMDIFIRSKEGGSSEMEKNTMKNLTDNELGAVMIGDVKISMPGLFTQLKQINKNKKQKGQKS
jgi:hypothetical protein